MTTFAICLALIACTPDESAFNIDLDNDSAQTTAGQASGSASGQASGSASGSASTSGSSQASGQASGSASGQATGQEQEPKINPYRQFQLHTLQKSVVTTTAEAGEKAGEELKFDVWVMDEEAKRQEGMMFLEEEDFTEFQGMIFVFRNAQLLSFWMRNTFVPLDIAYLDANGVAVQTYTMKPFDVTTDYGSRRPAKYALEVKAGTFEKYGLRAGTKFNIPEDLVAKN